MIKHGAEMIRKEPARAGTMFSRQKLCFYLSSFPGSYQYVCTYESVFTKEGLIYKNSFSGSLSRYDKVYTGEDVTRVQKY
jgi:hypothetical protein